MAVTLDAPPRPSRAATWLPMLFIGLGISMVVMDATIVNVSLPSIIRDLGIDSIDAEWINAIYSLVFAALLIIAGRLGDRIGRRALFVAGAAVFGVASVGRAAGATPRTMTRSRNRRLTSSWQCGALVVDTWLRSGPHKRMLVT